jgi:hypothetical protein
MVKSSYMKTLQFNMVNNLAKFDFFGKLSFLMYFVKIELLNLNLAKFGKI